MHGVRVPTCSEGHLNVCNILYHIRDKIQGAIVIVFGKKLS